MFDRLESRRVAPSFLMASRKPPKKLPGAKPLPRPDQERADRLIALRRAFGYETAVAFAAFLGVSKQRYGHCERGGALGIELARLIVRKLPGVDLDYLYDGKPEGLSVELARRLGLFDRPGK